MKRVEDVLGKGWENHVEGQKLKADGDSFRMKLSTQEIFDDWARKVQQRNLGVSGRIFAIDSQRSKTGKGSQLRLKVNFLPEIIQLSKEVRNLKSLGFRVPLAIVNKAHQVSSILVLLLLPSRSCYFTSWISDYDTFYTFSFFLAL